MVPLELTAHNLNVVVIFQNNNFPVTRLYQYYRMLSERHLHETESIREEFTFSAHLCRNLEYRFWEHYHLIKDPILLFFLIQEVCWGGMESCRRRIVLTVVLVGVVLSHADVGNLFFFPYAVLCDTCWSWPLSKALWSVVETGRWLSCLVWQIYFLFVSIVFPSERVKMLLKWIIYHGEGIDGSQSLWWSLLLKASHL